MNEVRVRWGRGKIHLADSTGYTKCGRAVNHDELTEHERAEPLAWPVLKAICNVCAKNWPKRPYTTEDE